MTHRSFAPAIRQVRQLFARSDAAGSSDAQLLQRFVNGGDEAAFEMLVWRHGPMVYGMQYDVGKGQSKEKLQILTQPVTVLGVAEAKGDKQ
jgi:hypothetical protein